MNEQRFARAQQSGDGTQSAAQVVSANAGDTRRIGRCLGAMLRPGDLVLLKGPFGAGKTTLTQGIARGLGIRDVVNSPSFTLVSQYRLPGDGKSRLFHIDLFRIGGTPEVETLGLDEYLNGDGICVVEWPQVAADVLAADRLEITLAFLGATGRTITFAAVGDRFAGLVAQFIRDCAQVTMEAG